MAHSTTTNHLRDWVHQGHLEHVLGLIFPQARLLRDARKDSNIENPITGHKFEMDIWIPDYNLCFEFQDIYHYMTTWYSVVPLDSVRTKDDLKRQGVIKKGGALVAIPCWWDGTQESLQASIVFERPDLDFPIDRPIPLNPPLSFFGPGVVPGVGELMLASNPPAVKSLIAQQPHWWMGEKYDGVRACWHAVLNQLYSKSGIAIMVPAAIHDNLKRSNQFLDCEMWFGRGNFHESQKLVTSENVIWTSLKILCFDNPKLEMQKEKFEERYKSLFGSIAGDHPVIVISSRVKYSGKSHINFWLKCLLQDGAEGIIIRKAESTYEHGRTESLLKIKASREEKEALVVSANADNTFTLQMYVLSYC